MAATCSHGLPADDCLICRTLPAGSSPSSGRAPEPHHHSHSVALTVSGALLALGAVAVVAWIVVGVVFAALRIIELALVAGAAGWAGYKLGHFRGSRRPR